jgi:HK97 family phage portal protein
MWKWLSDWWNDKGASPPREKARGTTLTSFLNPTVTGQPFPVLAGTEIARHNRGWVYAAVRVVSQRIAGQPIRVGRKTSRGDVKGTKAASVSPPWIRPGTVQELDDHPVLDVLHDPNHYLTAWGLIYLAVASLELTGCAFIWWDDQPDGSTVAWFLPSSWVYDDPEAIMPFTQWKIRPAASGEEFTLTDAELIRISLPDPSNPLYPLGPLQAAGAAVLTDEHIQTAQLQAFKNGMLPGVMVRVGKPAEFNGIGGERPTLTKEQRENLMAALKRQYSGSNAAGEPLILDGIIEGIEKLSMTPAEMDFSASGDITKDRIVESIGVNPIVMGHVEGANRASATVADEHLCFSSCGPLCVLIGQHLTRWLSNRYADEALVVWIDPPRPRDPDGRRADLDQLGRYGAITVNELRAEHGLPPIDGGDVPVKGTPAPASDPRANPSDGKGWDALTQEERLAVFYRTKANGN